MASLAPTSTAAQETVSTRSAARVQDLASTGVGSSALEALRRFSTTRRTDPVHRGHGHRVLVIGLVFVGGAVALLTAISSRGGQVGDDAAEIAEQTIAQSGAFRGDSPDGRPAWDGKERLKRLEGNDGGLG